MDQIIKLILSEKGRDANRVLMLTLMLWTVSELRDVRGVMASHAANHNAHAGFAVTAPGTNFASVGPQWPRNVAGGFQR